MWNKKIWYNPLFARFVDVCGFVDHNCLNCGPYISAKCLIAIFSFFSVGHCYVYATLFTAIGHPFCIFAQRKENKISNNKNKNKGKKKQEKQTKTKPTKQTMKYKKKQTYKENRKQKKTTYCLISTIIKLLKGLYH